MRNTQTTVDDHDITDKTAREQHMIKFKRKYNKDFNFDVDGGANIINQNPSDITYIYFISYNSSERYGGAGLQADSH